MAERLRLSRAQGYRKPDNAIVVARPTRWGNPFRYRAEVGGLVREPGVFTGQSWEFEGRISAAGNRHDLHLSDGRRFEVHVRWATRAEVVELFRRALLRVPDEGIRAAWGANDRAVKVTVDEVRSELAGHDLACWCPLDVPCHADVLLAVANGTPIPELIDTTSGGAS